MRVETVVKFGGGLLAHVEHFDAALATIGVAATSHQLLIVPGGGPFADAVRDADRRLGLSDAAAHWMAVLAMDQYAHVIAEKLPRAVIVAERREIGDALRAQPVGHIPVLAPYRWLRETDPLPHSWEVTSDSIAAWVAGAGRCAPPRPCQAAGRHGPWGGRRLLCAGSPGAHHAICCSG